MSDIGTVQPSSVQPAALSARGERKLDQLRDSAAQVVGSVFYGTLLKNLRSSSLQGEIGHGGRGEEVFQAQLDQVLAERAGQARNFDLADVIVRRFERQVRVLWDQRPVGGDES